MESSVSALILVSATLIIGLVVIGFIGSYFSIIYAEQSALDYARSVSAMLKVDTVYNNNSVLVILYSYTYNGSLYILAFEVPSSYFNPSLTPQFPYASYVQLNGVPPYSLEKTMIGPIFDLSNKQLTTGKIPAYKLKVFQVSSNGTAVYFYPPKSDEVVIIWVIFKYLDKYYLVYEGVVR